MATRLLDQILEQRETEMPFGGTTIADLRAEPPPIVLHDQTHGLSRRPDDGELHPFCFRVGADVADRLAGHPVDEGIAAGSA